MGPEEDVWTRGRKAECSNVFLGPGKYQCMKTHVQYDPYILIQSLKGIENTSVQLTQD